MRRPLVATLLGAVLGAGAGFLYWRYVGCTSGTCAITSHPLNSTIYGALMGALLFNALRPPRRDRSTTTN